MQNKSVDKWCMYAWGVWSVASVFLYRKPVQPPVILPKPPGSIVSLSSEFFQSAVEKSLQPGVPSSSVLAQKRKLSEEENNATSQVTKVSKPNPPVQAKTSVGKVPECGGRMSEQPKELLEEPQPQTENKELPQYAQEMVRSFSEKVRLEQNKLYIDQIECWIDILQ